MCDTKKILVAEDDKRINEIICDYLEMEGYAYHKAYDGMAALELFEREPFDLVILDIMMPNLDGWTVCRRLRKKSDVLIVILSARSDEEDKLMGFELGADEYVDKPFSPKVLMARIRALLARAEANQVQLPKADFIIERGKLCINKEEYSVKVEDQEVTLTAKEFNILVLLCENENKVFTREMILEKVWGYDYFGDGRVIDTNIKTLRKKLLVAAKYILTVVGVGYKFQALD